MYCIYVYLLGCLNSNFFESSNLFIQIICSNSDNLVLAPMRVTYSWPRGKYTVTRNVCSNGALCTAAIGTILFCGEIS